MKMKKRYIVLYLAAEVAATVYLSRRSRQIQEDLRATYHHVAETIDYALALANRVDDQDTLIGGVTETLAGHEQKLEAIAASFRGDQPAWLQ